MKKKFSKTLEERANDISAYPAKNIWEDSIPAMLTREIALTVDQIKRLRDRHDQ
jgi:hypothetical protein